MGIRSWSQDQEEQKEPSPNSIKRGCRRSLEFETQTTHGLLAEFRGLRTCVSRRRTTTTRTPPKSTIREHTKNLIVAHRRCLPIRDLETKLFLCPELAKGPFKDYVILLGGWGGQQKITRGGEMHQKTTLDYKESQFGSTLV